jgi:hypothetical protein
VVAFWGGPFITKVGTKNPFQKVVTKIPFKILQFVDTSMTCLENLKLVTDQPENGNLQVLTDDTFDDKTPQPKILSVRIFMNTSPEPEHKPLLCHLRQCWRKSLLLGRNLHEFWCNLRCTTKENSGFYPGKKKFSTILILTSFRERGPSAFGPSLMAPRHSAKHHSTKRHKMPSIPFFVMANVLI